MDCNFSYLLPKGSPLQKYFEIVDVSTMDWTAAGYFFVAGPRCNLLRDVPSLQFIEKHQIKFIDGSSHTRLL